MFCRRLVLANFRNYERLDLNLSPRLSIFWGDNGQGKSNLLEALYLLATSRSHRTSAERELVNWHAGRNAVGPAPVFARAAAEVVHHQTTTRIEIVLAEPPPAGPVATTGAPRPAAGEVGQAPAAAVRRRVRINGHHRPPSELLGHLNVVLFSPEDVALIAGPAELRRRYLNITLCQVDQHYLRTLRRYLRVLQQRNALLREQRERPVGPGPFEYWDAQLVELGAALMAGWLRALALLNEHLAALHIRLTNEPAALRAEYRPSVPLGDELGALAAAAAAAGETAVAARIRERFAAHLAALWPRERQQGVTLAGPHRDDAGFYADAVDLRVYGSRGQQRTAALGLKLAEVALMERYTAERPVLLLDDVLSELDPGRRGLLQAVVLEQPQQVLVTATDLAPFSSDALGQADLYRVEAGQALKS